MGDVRVDPATGEVLEDKPRRRRRGPPKPPRAVTPVERAELEAREAWREKKAADRERRLALMESLVPSLPTEGEPRAQNERLIEIDGRTGRGDVRAKVTRADTGSQVVAVAKHYDGAEGRPPRHYLHLSVWYRCGSGEQFRTRGVALESPEEMRAVARACLELAAEVERGS